MQVTLPKLTTYQKEVYDWLDDPYRAGKTAVVKSVRQSGKSFFACCVLTAMALQHTCTSIVVEPTLEQSRNIFKKIFKTLEANNLIKNANSQTLSIQVLNGSEIIFKSTQQGESALRGYTVSGLLVLDEAAYLPDEQIYTLLPTIQTNNASLLVISTPFIPDGFFYRMYSAGMSSPTPTLKSFDWSCEDEVSRFLTDERKKFYKETMSPAKYQTEVLGEFLTSDGLLFAGFDKCIKGPGNTQSLFIGIDFASGGEGDYTVLTAMNQQQEMVEVIRTNNMTPTQQVDWLVSNIVRLKGMYPVKKILGEKNSIGVIYIDTINQQLRQYGLQISEWITSNESKRNLVESLQIGFANQGLAILDDPNLINELRHYEAEVNPTTKVIRYNGKGANDDMVMSLMLAYEASKKQFNNYSISFL